MQIAILCAGRLREKYWQDAAAEYIKRMGRYGRLEVIEAPDQPEGPQAMKKEAEAMLAHLRPDDYVTALCIEGKPVDSLQLAAFFREREMLVQFLEVSYPDRQGERRDQGGDGGNHHPAWLLCGLAEGLGSFPHGKGSLCR